MVRCCLVCEKYIFIKVHCHHYHKGSGVCTKFSLLTSAQQQLKWATIWPQQTWAKHWGGAVPLLGGGSWVPM